MHEVGRRTERASTDEVRGRRSTVPSAANPLTVVVKLHKEKFSKHRRQSTEGQPTPRVSAHIGSSTQHKDKRLEWHAQRELQLELMNQGRKPFQPHRHSRRHTEPRYSLPTEEAPPTAPEQPELSQYLVGHVLGQGACATVREAFQRDTLQRVAIKSYSKEQLRLKHQEHTVQREAAILTQLQHPGIVRLFETIDGPHHLHLVTEYVGGTNLLGLLKRKRKLDIATVQSIFRQLVNAVEYCHSRGVTHRDIKLENVIIEANNAVKLIDFGFSTSSPVKTRVFCGTPSYMAPEIIAQKQYLGPPVDIWALGVLLFAMITGNYPFSGVSDKDLYKEVLRGKVQFPGSVPTSAKKLIARMLTYSPEKRPTARQILEDSWLTTAGGVSEKAFASTRDTDQSFNSSTQDIPGARIKTKAGRVHLKYSLSRGVLSKKVC